MEQYNVITWFLLCLSRSVPQNMCSTPKTLICPWPSPHTPPHPSPKTTHAFTKSPNPKCSYTALATDLHEGSPMSPTNTTTHLDWESRIEKEGKEKSRSLKKGYKTVERRRKTRPQRGWRMKWWKRVGWVRVDGEREKERSIMRKRKMDERCIKVALMRCSPQHCVFLLCLLRISHSFICLTSPPYSHFSP